MRRFAAAFVSLGRVLYDRRVFSYGRALVVGIAVELAVTFGSVVYGVLLGLHADRGFLDTLIRVGIAVVVVALVVIGVLVRTAPRRVDRTEP